MQQDRFNQTQESNEEEEYDDVYIVFDIKDFDNTNLLSSVNSYSIIGLETEHPLVKLGQFVFEGTWDQLMGTALLFKHKNNNHAMTDENEKGKDSLEYSNIKTRKVLRLIEFNKILQRKKMEGQAAFFGIWIRLDEVKVVSIPQDLILHITQATLLTSNNSNSNSNSDDDNHMNSHSQNKEEDNSYKLFVIIENEYQKKKEFALCHLTNAAECHKLNLCFTREDGHISFQLAPSSKQRINATACVHLMGHYIDKHQSLYPFNNAQGKYYHYHQPDYFSFAYDDNDADDEEDEFLFGYSNDAFFYDQSDDDDDELDEAYDDYFPLHDMIPELYSSILSPAPTIPKSTVQFEDITDKEEKINDQ